MSNYLESLKKKLEKKEVTPENTTQELPQDTSKAISEEVDLDTEKKESALEVPKTAPALIVPDVEKRFFLTQTLIKEITDKHGEYKQVCPRYIYENFITKQYRTVTLPMMHGIFGESLVLGGGARGQKLEDLPRHKKSGEKLTAQLNIEEQARRFPLWCSEKGISVIPGINTQVPIAKRLNKNVIVRTEIDLFPTPFLMEGKYMLSVMDVKFTADVNSRFGDYCWGAPEFVDHLQADMTYWLLQDFDMELNVKLNPEKQEIYKSIFENEAVSKMIKNEDIVFIYFIIGYKKQPLYEQVNFIYRSYREANGSLLRQDEFKERARKTLAQLSEWKAQNWPAKEDNYCDKCPVSQKNGGYCTQFNKIKTI